MLEHGSDFRGHLHAAVQAISDCLDRFSPDQLALSFNGGKDCVVLLHLLRAVLHLRGQTVASSGLSVLYFAQRNEFEQLSEFLHAANEKYGAPQRFLELGADFKAALECLTSDEGHNGTSLKAVLMGQREADPGASSLNVCSRTDVSQGWPSLLRVNPILRWDHAHVWHFLCHYNVPHCVLYDHGYTSLGSRCTTIPNPLLLHETKDDTYLPARCLLDQKYERMGRAFKSREATAEAGAAALVVVSSKSEVSQMSPQESRRVAATQKCIRKIATTLRTRFVSSEQACSTVNELKRECERIFVAHVDDDVRQR
ncbi:MAG: hypothetical protein MHM6MM_000794 [Cercozoa sp. M6MM]